MKLLHMAVPVALTLLCLIPTCDAPTHAGTHEGIWLRECAGGTAWNQVEIGDCPLTLLTQEIQPVMRWTWASRKAFSCRKKPHRLRPKQRLKACSKCNIMFLLLLLLLAGDVETNPGPVTTIMYSTVIKFLLFAITCIVITEKGLCRVEWKRHLSNGSEFDSTTTTSSGPTGAGEQVAFVTAGVPIICAIIVAVPTLIGGSCCLKYCLSPEKPQITQQPAENTERVDGEDVEFTITATVTGEDKNLIYQWQKNNKDITGATECTYRIDKVEKSDEGNYRCLVSSPPRCICIKSNTTSNSSRLRVITPPEITQHPVDKMNVAPGSQVTFTVDARTDAGTLTYQWQQNNANLSGANTNTLTINSVQESNKGEYRCIVSNAPKSTTTSNAAQLTLYHSEFPSDPEEKNKAIRSKYANTLKDKYRLNVPNFLTLQWPPPPTLKVFNLAMISQGKLRYGADDELVRLLLRGQVSDVVSQTNAVTLEQISDSLHSKGRKVILIEGAPGAGKSTLAWHLCKMWEAGKLFQEFELVLFVQLREPAIQSAKSLEDLLLAETLSTKEVISAIQYCGGHQVLIVLDSWDEFPPGLDQKSIIGQLICNPSKLDMQFSALIITSRPVATAQLLRRRLTTTRIEIVGFLRTEIQCYFTEAIGDSQIVKKLNDHLTQRPVIEASCYLPLNTAIVAHLFLALGHTLPTTLHGVFTSLIICCIIRHMKKQGKNIKISSLDELPLDIQEQFNNLCTLAYHGVMENKATFSEDDLQSFKLPTELSTLSLMQGVASLTAFGESRLYNFLHLSTQELLAAYFITKMRPEEQVKVFNELFEQPRFANVFQFYAGFSKLQTEGIQDTISRIVKSKNNILILSLLHCLYEAQDDKLCQFVSSQLEAELDLTNQALSPVDCLSVGYTARSVCSTTPGRFKLKLTTTRFDEYGTKLMLKELSKYSTPSVLETAAKTKELQNLHLELYGERSTSSFAEQATIISKLGQYLRVLNLWDNQIGNAGAESLGTALKECTKLESLNLGRNAIGPEGVQHLVTVLEKMVQLKELHLERNGIGPEGVQHLVTVLEKMVQLKTLDLGENKIGPEGVQHLVTVLEKMVQLKELNLRYNQIGNAGAESLRTALKECTKLEYLNLNSNQLGDDGVDAISTSLTKLVHLRELYLYENGFTDVGCTALGAALKDCRNLQVLDLEGNQISDSGCVTLCDAVRHCTELQVLSLQLNRISDGSIHKLRELIKRGKFLKGLYLEFNQFTKKGKTQLREAAAERNHYPDFVELIFGV